MSHRIPVLSHYNIAQRRLLRSCLCSVQNSISGIGTAQHAAQKFAGCHDRGKGLYSSRALGLHAFHSRVHCHRPKHHLLLLHEVHYLLQTATSARQVNGHARTPWFDLNALLTVQAATNEQHSPGSGSLAADSVSKTLHIQAAKVVAAHAASVGDSLLGVPLLCSAGEPAVHILPWAHPHAQSCVQCIMYLCTEGPVQSFVSSSMVDCFGWLIVCSVLFV